MYNTFFSHGISLSETIEPRSWGCPEPPYLWHCFLFGPMLRHRLSSLLIIVMYSANLDGFRHDGPFVSRNQPKYRTRPAFGLAGFVMPADPEVVLAEDRDPVRTAGPFSSQIRTCANRCALPQEPPAVNKPSPQPLHLRGQRSRIICTPFMDGFRPCGRHAVHLR